MTISALLAALALPVACRVDQRVPKKMLIENAAPTAVDKRLLNDAIEDIQWIAALKPGSVGVAEYRDEQRAYREVAVLSVSTAGASGPGAGIDGPLADNAAIKPFNAARLAELVHRAVPYPVLLLLATPQGLFLSGAHKRWAQNEATKVVLDGEVITVQVDSDLTPAHPFMQSIALARQPQANLMTLYHGWLDCFTAVQAARYTKHFKLMDDPVRCAARRMALRECQRLEHEAARLRVQVSKEKQMAKQVELNLALKRIQAEMVAAREQL